MSGSVFVGQLEVDQSGAEHDEREGVVAGVKAVGASHDEADLVVETLDADLC